MTTTELADIIQRQLSRHGYHLSVVELQDVAANLIMCLGGMDDNMTAHDKCNHIVGRYASGIVARCDRPNGHAGQHGGDVTDTSGTWSPAQATQRT